MAVKCKLSLWCLLTFNSWEHLVWWHGNIFYIGIFQTIESAADQVGVFNPDTESWVLRKTQGAIPTKRASAAMTTSKDGIIMFGGVNTQEWVASHT